MVVKRPLEKRQSVNIEELIDRGARVKEDNTETLDQIAFINLRIPKYLLDSINLAKKQRVGISRTGWILEAIQEKLEKSK